MTDRQKSNERRFWFFGIGFIAVLGAVLASAPYLARRAIKQVAYEACVEVVPSASSEQCECLASKVSDHMVSSDYLYRRWVRDQGIPDKDMAQMRRACKLPQ